MDEEIDQQQMEPQTDDVTPSSSTASLTGVKDVEFGVLISVKSASPALEELRFRFQFPRQDGVVTPVLQEWESVHIDDVDPFKSSVADSEETNETASELSKKPPTNSLWTFCAKFSAKIDLEWAKLVDTDPNILFTLCKNNDSSWEGAFSVDISPLFSGDTRIDYISGAYPGSENKYTSPPSHESINALRIAIIPSEVILTEDLCKLVNPLTVSILTVRPLPGLRVEEGNPKMLPYVIDPVTNEKDPYKLQKKYCAPVYATVEIFPGLVDRHLKRSVEFIQGTSKINLQCTTTLLVGLIENQNTVAEYLENCPVVVNIHDRDVSLLTTDVLVKRHYESSQAKYNPVEKPSEEEQPGPDGDEEQENFVPPTKSVFCLDREVYQEYIEILDLHSKQQTVGKASFPMNELYSSSRELIQRHANDLYGRKDKFSIASKAVEIKTRAGVTPVKRDIPVGGQVEKAELDIIDEERMVRQPGRFFEAGTEVRLSASINYPIFKHRLSLDTLLEGEAPARRNPCFERVVFLFEYTNSAFMQRLRQCLVEINEAALPHAESLRSYQLTEQEKFTANSGELDIITGFQVLDDQFRIIVLEGISEKGIKTLFDKLPREQRNTEQFKTLSNSKIRFTNRFYTDFEVDLKVVRLRYPLCYIMQAPEIYDSFKVDLQCHRALTLLAEIRSSERLETLFRNQTFPTTRELTKLESKYGESVSIQDIEGVDNTQKRKRRNRRVPNNQIALVSSESEEDRVESDPSKKHGEARRKAATDSQNPGFLQHLRNRETKDFLSEHGEIRRQMKQNLKQRMEERSRQDQEILESFGLNKQAYNYSGQKLNFVDMQQDRLRKRLSKQTGATYTYSEKFQSLGFCLVKEDDIHQHEKAQRRAKFITPSGFVYPASRTAKETRQLKLQVSEARADELRTPWEEPGRRPRRRRRRTEDEDEDDEPKDFDCIPTKDYEVFGGYHKDGTRNPNFFTSVHLAGDGVELAMMEKKKRELEEWRSKVLVDNLTFRAHQGIKSEKPSQLDKLKDILQSKPKKKGLRIVRNAVLPSGKKVPLRQLPVSIHL